MIAIIALAASMFGLGLLVGGSLTWWWMNRQWQRYPYTFRTMIDGVIALREQRQHSSEEEE